MAKRDSDCRIVAERSCLTCDFAGCAVNGCPWGVDLKKNMENLHEALIDIFVEEDIRRMTPKQRKESIKKADKAIKDALKKHKESKPKRKPLKSPNNQKG